MAKLFHGVIQNRIDTKGRVSVPAPFRRALEAGDPDFAPGSNAHMTVLHWPTKNCLEVYTENGMDEISKKIARYPHRSKDRENLARLYFSNSQHLQLDETGRVVISEKLRNAAGLGEDVVFVGSMDKFEIWNHEEYIAEMALIESSDNEFLDAPFGTEPSDA